MKDVKLWKYEWFSKFIYVTMPKLDILKSKTRDSNIAKIVKMVPCHNLLMDIYNFNDIKSTSLVNNAISTLIGHKLLNFAMWNVNIICNDLVMAILSLTFWSPLYLVSVCSIAMTDIGSYELKNASGWFTIVQSFINWFQQSWTSKYSHLGTEAISFTVTPVSLSALSVTLIVNPDIYC